MNYPLPSLCRSLGRLTAALAGLFLIVRPLSAQTAPPSDIASEDDTVVLSPFEVSTTEDVGYRAGTTLSGSRMNSKLKDTPAAVQVLTKELLEDFGANSFEEMLALANNVQIDYADTSADATPSYLASALIPDKRFRIRGLPASKALDYFETIIPIDGYNTSRVELSNGPNSILFGAGSPGGLINTSTERALTTRNETRMRFGVGSWDYQRAELNHNQVLLKDKLALRIAGLWEDEESWRAYEFETSERYSGSLRWEPFKNTSVTYNYEQGSVQRQISRPWNAFDELAQWLASDRPVFNANSWNRNRDRPLGVNRLTNTRTFYVEDSGGNSAGAYAFTTGNAANLRFLQSLYENTLLPIGEKADESLLPEAQLPYEYSAWGPDSFKDVHFDRHNVRIEQRVGENTFLDFAYNHELTKGYAQAPTGRSITLYGDPNSVIPNPDGSGTQVDNPNAGGLYFESRWGGEAGFFENEGMRAAINHDLNLGKFGRHRLAGLVERGELRQQRYALSEIWVDETGAALQRPATPENNENAVFRRVYVDEGNFSTYTSGNFNKPATFSRDGHTYTSRLAHYQASGDITQTTESFLLATQSYFWDNRIIATAGYRKDDITFEERVVDRAAANDPRVVSGEVIENELLYTDEIASENGYAPETVSLGTVFHATDWFSVFYNYSDNSGAPAFGQRILPDESLAPPTKGVTNDYGFILTLFDEKLSLRATFYETNQDAAPAVNLENSATNIIRPNEEILIALQRGNRITDAEYQDHLLGEEARLVGLADVKTKGFEIEATFNLTRNFTSRISYSHTDVDRSNVMPEFDDWFATEKAFWLSTAGAGDLVTSRETTVSQEITELDRVSNYVRDFYGFNYGVRPHKVNASARYTFNDGWLDGFFLGGNVQWQDKAKVGRAILDYDATNNPIYGEVFYGAERFSIDSFLGYRTRINWGTWKPRLTIQLNVRNLTDEPVVEPLRYNNLKSGYSRVLLNDPRSYRISATLEF